MTERPHGRRDNSAAVARKLCFHSAVTHRSPAAAHTAGPSIRDRTGNDLQECVRVLGEVHRSDGYPVNWPEDPAGWLSRGSELGAWIVEADGRVAGHVSLAPGGADDVAPGVWSEHGAERAPDRTAVLGRLFVAPRARGRGVGALLIGRAVERARHAGLHPVLDVVSTDTAAMALYERLGWQPMATVQRQWTPGRTVTLHCYSAPPGVPAP